MEADYRIQPSPLASSLSFSFESGIVTSSSDNTFRPSAYSSSDCELYIYNHMMNIIRYRKVMTSDAVTV